MLSDAEAVKKIESELKLDFTKCPSRPSKFAVQAAGMALARAAYKDGITERVVVMSNYDKGGFQYFKAELGEYVFADIVDSQEGHLEL